jgi:hypothetical protein
MNMTDQKIFSFSPFFLTFEHGLWTAELFGNELDRFLDGDGALVEAARSIGRISCAPERSNCRESRKRWLSGLR